MRFAIPSALPGTEYTPFDLNGGLYETADIRFHDTAAALARCAYVGGLPARAGAFL